MPPLPRAKCPVCHRKAAVRKGGELREHRDNRLRGFATPPVCPGSGRAPNAAFQKGDQVS